MYDCEIKLMSCIVVYLGEYIPAGKRLQISLTWYHSIDEEKLWELTLPDNLCIRLLHKVSGQQPVHTHTYKQITSLVTDIFPLLMFTNNKLWHNQHKMWVSLVIVGVFTFPIGACIGKYS